jgi:dCTP deaminase
VILSDREIKLALERGLVRITPLPAARAWSSTAVDLGLASELTRWQPPTGRKRRLIFSPADADFNFQELVKTHGRSFHIPEEGFVLEPGQFVLGWTVEKIQIPHRSRLAARVEGKSTLARLGLGIHVTAPTIHAGFGYTNLDPDFLGSPIQLEIWNIAPVPIRLKMGMAICQLVFEEVHGTPEKGYEGLFAVQGPGGPEVGQRPS